MKLLDEQPHCKVWCKDGSTWMLPLEDWDRFRVAFKKGDAFWDGRSVNGAEVCFKIGDINGIVRCDQDWLDLEEEMGEERKRRKLTEGEP